MQEKNDPSPTNACIRAAQRVLAAMNLPEGAGVYWDFDEWFVCMTAPVAGLNSWQTPGIVLPDTAVPPWPGDFRESWITALTEEVTP